VVIRNVWAKYYWQHLSLTHIGALLGGEGWGQAWNMEASTLLHVTVSALIRNVREGFDVKFCLEVYIQLLFTDL